MTRPLFLAALLCATPASAQLFPSFEYNTVPKEEPLAKPAPIPPAVEYALPDPEMTPGAVDTAQEVFCHQKAKERRHLRPGVSDAIARAYNVPPADIGVRYQLDHLVPLSIGGMTTAANLWPQPMAEAYVKDRCDRRIHYLVCHEIVLALEAQREIAADWPTACAKYIGR